MLGVLAAGGATGAPSTTLQPALDFKLANTQPCEGVVDNFFNATELPDRAAWRQAIHDAQNPPDCSKAKLCKCGNAKFGQTFSELHATAACLLRSVLMGCTLIEEPVPYKEKSFTEECMQTHGLHACYMMKLSRCSSADAADGAESLHEVDNHQGREQLLTACGQAQDRWGVPGALACFGDIVSYVMRPSRRLANAVHSLTETLKLGDCDGRTPLEQTVAVHLRYGDKPSTLHTERETVAHAALAHSHARTLGLKAVHFMSDSFDARKPFADHLRAQDSGLLVRSVPEKMQVFTGDTDKKADEQIRAAGHVTDQHLLVLAEVYLMAQSAVLVGPQVSNVDRTIAELMVNMHPRPIIDDVYHDAWTPGMSHETHNGNAWNLGSLFPDAFNAHFSLTHDHVDGVKDGFDSYGPVRR